MARRSAERTRGAQLEQMARSWAQKSGSQEQPPGQAWNQVHRQRSHVAVRPVRWGAGAVTFHPPAGVVGKVAGLPRGMAGWGGVRLPL